MNSLCRFRSDISFFFSSRRRHTRCKCDWSSDVCSSDLVRPPDVHFPHTGLLCLENTHNRCGGTVLSEADMQATAQVARRWGFPVHLDGARVFNAAVALGVPGAALARPAGSVALSPGSG